MTRDQALTNIRYLDALPESTLASALARFESGFRYPLGKDGWFSISHGDDYTRFFRAIGDTRCFVADRDGTVVGVVSVARCQLRQPGGVDVEAAYFSDLKVTRPGSGRALLRLLQESVGWARQSPATPGFSIVMDGTSRDPSSYTGRLGIPQYIQLSKLMILRIPSDHRGDTAQVIESSLTEVGECYRGLTKNDYATAGGSPTIRSRMTPMGLILASGGACGILEDTRRGKRLYRGDGSEMVSAHLSSFGYRTAQDAVSLLKSASVRCREMGVPAIFVSLPWARHEAVLKLLPQNGIVKAPATVFGFGFCANENWSVNTSEI